ncbi:MAG: hypothetical protein A2175_02655 [Candidatus Nealsonbacteria bacterium RBG_13_42_11]|uniref:Uncharacterized protein n=1 Tax=Candidatus Nealsonbacteria bacterium RBG_13_42_11 TaxID=1801663 RepID=A0A1G2DYG3_9BACT|nr:MAG: hypothetical protein A2175_02655 [Candidatus Nealsonbacteria bacterium RBG_13_42_11]
MDALTVITEIMKVNPRIESLNFISYKPTPHDDLEKKIKKEFVSMEKRLFHDPDKTDKAKVQLERDGLTISKLQEIIGRLGVGFVLAILSNVEIDGKTFHIPMMDFDCQNSEESIKEIKQFLHKAGQKEGVILFSGMSFHYYGSRLLDEKGLLNFLGDCLLSGLTGQRYIGHRLKEQRLIMRISSCPLRPRVPFVVSIIGAAH